MELRSEPPRSQQSCKLWSSLTAFYHNHFPTDKQSFNQRIPFLGYVCTVSSAICMIPWIPVASGILFVFLLLSFGFAYQLYCGLNNADRKQFTPWIILKCLELLSVIIINIISFISVGPYLEYYSAFLVLFIVSTIFNLWIFYIVVAKSYRMRNFRIGKPICMASSNNEGSKCQFGTGSVIIECTSEQVIS